MAAPKNRFKEALLKGRVQIGLWQGLASPTSVEICAQAGFDWLVIDGEHGPNHIRSLLGQLMAAKGTGAHPVVRLVEGNVAMAKQAMDIGAQTLLIPMIDTPEEAEMMARAMRYPPEGIRGAASLVRAAGYGMDPDYLPTANSEAFLIVQAESRTAIDNLEAICGVQGVDAVFIGPSDLSASMGYLGQPMVDEVQRTIEDSIKRIQDCGKIAGILMANEEKAKRYIELGAKFVAVGSDVVLLGKAAQATVSRYRDGASSEGDSGAY